MKYHQTFKQAVRHQQEKQARKGKGRGLPWWQLSLIGIGSIIGAGFFLGTGLSIRLAGPSILIGYLFAGVTAYFVFSALAEMTVNDPQPGSFRTYAKKAFGSPYGFVIGWMYWLSGILIMSSEIVALSTFTQFWFPHTPLWIFTIVFALLGFGINLMGMQNFGKIESLFAMIKLSTLVVFIVFGVLFLLGAIHPSAGNTVRSPGNFQLFPNGITGLWSALIFIFFSFGGMEVVGVASAELKNQKDIPKTGYGLLITLVAIYVLSLLFVVLMAGWRAVNASESPFVTALSAFHIPYLDSIFNVIIISAAFSTMVGALFSITQILVALADDGDAPKKLEEKNKRGVAIYALLLTAAGLAVSVLFSFLLPKTLYEYVTTAAGVLLILNWVNILASHIKLHPTYARKQGTYKVFGYPFTSFAGIAFILAVISGGLLHRNERIGLLVSFGLMFAIFLCSKWMRRRNRAATPRPEPDGPVFE
ncbi:transporter [Weizmannia acidilactici]|uniref:Transporter n=1 Tax=Weizmannia acidilactici TaxID=2607726 RepID=A0A5J4JM40_9BACI|nr:amino acid permease [Weizmannia acidilactici]GER67347.1 transporter [Weizmannia acidilactici]GER70064.1 transporter [Weizmannia acidilactici]GER74268.1 transporter [Weizmannia acidilactici]